jgi:hypothetical protein
MRDHTVTVIAKGAAGIEMRRARLATPDLAQYRTQVREWVRAVSVQVLPPA